MNSSIILDQHLDGKSVDQTSHWGMNGSLLYLFVSRPNIMFYVCLCARFHANFKESRLIVVMRIFRLLHRT